MRWEERNCLVCRKCKFFNEYGGCSNSIIGSDDDAMEDYCPYILEHTVLKRGWWYKTQCFWIAFRWYCDYKIDRLIEYFFSKRYKKNRKKLAPWYIRIAVRMSVKWFLKKNRKIFDKEGYVKGYQCTGTLNWILNSALDSDYRNSVIKHLVKEKIDVDSNVYYYDIAHWVLNSVGYEYSVSTMLEKYDGDTKVIDEKNGL